MKAPSVFLSHSSKDKIFVRRLAKKLEKYNVKVWLDEAEINIGDSLIKKISVAVNEMDYLLVVLSENSIQSKWVHEELEMAFSDQLSLNKVKILPVLKDEITIPPELKYISGKLYADFSTDEKLEQNFSKLLKSIGIETVEKKTDSINSVSIHFEYIYEKKHWWYNNIRAKWILFDNEEHFFEGNSALINTAPGYHTIIFCVTIEQLDEHSSYFYEDKSKEYKNHFTSGDYFYECDIKQRRDWILINKNEPLIQFVSHKLQI